MPERNTRLADTITQAAVALFRERGFDEVSVNDICREAGIARSSFYRIFSGKKEIIRYVLENTQSRSIVGIGDIVAAENAQLPAGGDYPKHGASGDPRPHGHRRGVQGDLRLVLQQGAAADSGTGPPHCGDPL